MKYYIYIKQITERNKYIFQSRKSERDILAGIEVSLYLLADSIIMLQNPQISFKKKKSKKLSFHTELGFLNSYKNK